MNVANILNALHRAFGTITDVRVLAKCRDYADIERGPIVTESDRAEIMLAAQKRFVFDVGGAKVKLKEDGRAVVAFVNAYRDSYNALYSDMVSRDADDTNAALDGLIARTMVTQGERAAMQMLIEMSGSEDFFTDQTPPWIKREIEHADQSEFNARLLERYRHTKANLVEVLSLSFREYQGDLIGFVRERYAPIGETEKHAVNAAYKLAKCATTQTP